MVRNNKSPKKDKISTLVKSLNISDLSSVLQDFIENMIDSDLKDGILKDIPVINSLIALSKTAISIRDQFLIQKLKSFLDGIKDITSEERNRFLKDIENDPKYGERVGEHLILLLDRLDDLSKTEMITKLFRAYLRDDITYREFVRFSSIIDRAFVNDLSGFINILSEDTPRMRNPYVDRLYHLGLSEIVFDDSAYQKKKSGLDNITLGEMTKFFGDEHPIKFRVTEIACVIAQIVSGKKKIYGTDRIAQYRISRDARFND